MTRAEVNDVIDGLPTPRPGRALSALALVAALAAGCSSAPMVALGVGQDQVQELHAGDPVELISGPQGGYHVLFGVQCWGCPHTVEARYGVEDLATGELLTFDDLHRTLELVPRGDWDEYTPIVGFLRSSDPSEYVGREVRLWLDIVESGDEAASTEVAVVIE